MRVFQPNSYISIDFIEGFSEIYYMDDTAATFKNGTLAFSLGQIEAGNKRKDIKYNKLQIHKPPATRPMAGDCKNF